MLPIANTIGGNFIKAFIWGLILATISAVWWINLFPNLAGPNTSAGIFLTNLGRRLVEVAVAVYLWHLVYAFNLGAFYQPKDVAETEAASRCIGRDDHPRNSIGELLARFARTVNGARHDAVHVATSTYSTAGGHDACDPVRRIR